MTQLTVIDMIERLIAAPSVSSVMPEIDMGNEKVTHEIAGWCEDAGFAVEIMPIDNKPGHFNLIATLGRGSGGLVLAGHTDTVPFNEALWDSNPFVATQRNGRLHGLGTTDMKAFIALALEAARHFDPREFQRPLILLATADEESGMAGAQALLDAHRPKADFAIIGEPTNLKPVRMHKGGLSDGLRLVGRSGHSSDPSLGNNAMEGMYKVIGELLRFRDELKTQYNNPLFAVPHPTMNLGHIHGGDNPNRICGSCELTFDVRVLPGLELKELRETLHHRLANVVSDTGLQLEFTMPYNGLEPMETPADSPIVRFAERLTGAEAEAVSFGTEAPYFAEMGMDVVVLGPGDISTAHQPNEFLHLDRIEPTVSLLRNAVEQFCVRPNA
ncbi:MAG: acetylornithine deacetylase [Pseudomonadota bacterium]